MTVLSPSPIQRFVDANGNALSGGKVFTYQAGSSTKLATFTDSTGSTNQTDPIILNSRGEPQGSMGQSLGIWLAAGTAYKFVLAPASDTDPPTNPIWTIDNIIVPIIYTDVVLTFTGGPPTATQWLGGESIREKIIFPANFAGSGGLVPKTLPTASFVVSIKQNGVQIGTATCSTGGVWTFATSGGVTLNAGDALDFYAPGTPDATIADFGLTLNGTLG